MNEESWALYVGERRCESNCKAYYAWYVNYAKKWNAYHVNELEQEKII